MRALLIFLLSTTTCLALKCHVVTYGSLANETQLENLQECPIGANTCVKIVDFSRMAFSKQCQIANCTTSAGQLQAPANCFNSTNYSTGSIMSTCCCYGDGCNSSYSATWIKAILIFLPISYFLA